MKTIEEKLKEIKVNNRLLSDREKELNKIGFELCFISSKDANQLREHGKIVFPMACSRDWNKTFGYAIEK